MRYNRPLWAARYDSSRGQDQGEHDDSTSRYIYSTISAVTICWWRPEPSLRELSQWITMLRSRQTCVRDRRGTYPRQCATNRARATRTSTLVILNRGLLVCPDIATVTAARRGRGRSGSKTDRNSTEQMGSLIGAHAGFTITWENSATLPINGDMRSAQLFLYGVFERKASY